jgi:hypothetical protein
MLSISRELEVKPLGPVQLQPVAVSGQGPRLTEVPGATESALSGVEFQTPFSAT